MREDSFSRTRADAPKVRPTTIVVVSHTFATGPAQELVDYLRKKVEKVVFVGHPFSYSTDIRSSYDSYLWGLRTTGKKGKAWRLPGILTFAKDFIYTFLWLFKEKHRFDLYFGVDGLNCLAGLLLKRLGRVRIVVFYTIDYVHNRFENPILNLLYHRLDIYCVENADVTWNLSSRMSEARELFHAGRFPRPREITVPIGVRLDRIRPLPVSLVDRSSLVFIGHLRKGQGAELMIRSMASIIQKTPNARLFIVGTGPLEGELKQLVTNLQLEKHVEFKGFVERHEDVEKLLVKCGIGLAPYEPRGDNFTFFTDPGKPKLYLACGLPVIITGVPLIAEAIASERMGIVVRFDETELAEAAVRLMTDREFYEQCRRNALLFANRIGWGQIFDSALAEIL